jgi:hypothetical protein
MTKGEFAQWWSVLSSKLKPNTEIFHWSAHSQYHLKGSFRVVRVDSDRVWIEITKPQATKTVQRITLSGERLGAPYTVPVGSQWGDYLTKENFFIALRLWGDYCGRTISRKSMDADVGGSTYVISIIRWMEGNSNSQAPNS